MIPFKTIRWCVSAAAVWLWLGGFVASRSAAQDIYGGAAAKPTFTQSVKQTFSKMGDAITPAKPQSTGLADDDPTLLSSEGKPSVDLFLSMGKYYEEQNKMPEAEQQYKKALQVNPNHLIAMLAYAHFLENVGHYEDAVGYYQRAIKAHPKTAAVYNNLGLCHARAKKLKEATAALRQAIEFDPHNPLYRNNISALLVEQNKPAEAFEQLRAVHGDAKAYYNLGYLFNKKGDVAAAEHHFRQALLADPTLEPAQRWLAYLQNKSQPSSIDKNFKIIRPTRPAEIQPPAEDFTRALPPANPTPAPMTARLQDSFGGERRSSAPAQIRPENQHPVGQPSAPMNIMPPAGSTPPEPPDLDTSVPRRLPPVNGVRQPTDPADNWPSATDNSPVAPLPPVN